MRVLPSSSVLVNYYSNRISRLLAFSLSDHLFPWIETTCKNWRSLKSACSTVVTLGIHSADQWVAKPQERTWKDVGFHIHPNRIEREHKEGIQREVEEKEGLKVGIIEKTMSMEIMRRADERWGRWWWDKDWSLRRIKARRGRWNERSFMASCRKMALVLHHGKLCHLTTSCLLSTSHRPEGNKQASRLIGNRCHEFWKEKETMKKREIQRRRRVGTEETNRQRNAWKSWGSTHWDQTGCYWFHVSFQNFSQDIYLPETNCAITSTAFIWSWLSVRQDSHAFRLPPKLPRRSKLPKSHVRWRVIAPVLLLSKRGKHIYFKATQSSFLSYKTSVSGLLDSTVVQDLEVCHLCHLGQSQEQLNLYVIENKCIICI